MDFKSVINAVGCRIDEKFNADGRKYEIYTEKIEQGFKEPCFFIKPITQSRTAQLGGITKRYRKHLKVDIMFFAEESNKNRDIAEKTDEMLDCLARISVGDKVVKSSGISVEAVDNVVHFTADYDFSLVRLEDIQLMEQLLCEADLADKEDKNE